MRIPSGGHPVREIGEFALIDLIKEAAYTAPNSRVELGIGDDAAIWRPRPNREVVLTTDLLIEDVDFRLAWTDWESLGHKSLAVNLSDVAAMGASPRLALVSLGLRGQERDREILEFYRGVNALAQRFSTSVIGGDISESSRGIVVSVSIVAEGPPAGRTLLRRDAARPGDIVAVTGSLGMAAAGLRAYEWDLRTLDGGPAMRAALDRPCPRVLEGRLLLRCGVLAAMDLSDGLMGDLPKLCRASGVAAIIDQVRLPIPAAIRWAFSDWLELALRGGEDFELLFTCPPAVFERVVTTFRRAGLRSPIAIGEIIERRENEPEIKLRDLRAKLVEVEPGAFAHFSR